MNTELITKAKNYCKKYFFKLVINAVFGKTMKNVKKHRDIKLLTTEARRNYLVSEPSHHATKCFSESLVAIKTKRSTNTHE